MHIETERKFRVLSNEYKLKATESHRMTQGYIAHDAGRTVRVRISDDKAYLTIKGPSRNGMSRLEWEMEIPVSDAKDLLKLCFEGVIDKTRFIVPATNGRKFEVDEFYGDNEGLVMAEIELGSEDEAFEHPTWLGREVTGDKKYYNSHLLGYPYKLWSEE
ncbi:MAG: CYTH domain-containing protein [Bacteroidales bacterium]|nr:CYTH domain-containing protein [Bacteroidales bacterium]